MTLVVGVAVCGDPDNHRWVLRSMDFEDFASVSVFECELCGAVDHREGRVR